MAFPRGTADFLDPHNKRDGARSRSRFEGEMLSGRGFEPASDGALEGRASPRAEYLRSLPPELADFLSLPGPQSMVIRGRPGTGKTSLALSMLGGFAGHRVLVSGRTSRARLEREFPFLRNGGFAKDFSLIDAGAVAGTPYRPDTAAYARQLLLGAALGESADLGWLPAPIASAWSQVLEDTPTLVVLDSWDALVERYIGLGDDPEMPRRTELEEFLFSVLSRSRAHMIAILERESATHFEYLASANVSLSREMVGDHWERTISLEKMPETRISNAAYSFTLDAARFRVFGGSSAPGRFRRVRWEREEQPIPGALWPGARAFVAAFGRLPVGGLTLLYIDPELPGDAYRFLTEPMAASAIDLGSRLSFLAPPSLTLRQLWRPWSGVASAEELARNARFLVPALIDGAGIPAPLARSVSVHCASREDPGIGPASPFLEFLRAENPNGTPNLGIASMEGLRDAARLAGVDFGPREVPPLALGALETLPMHLLVFGRAGDPPMEALRDVAGLALRLHARRGAWFLSRLDRPSSTFGLVPEPSDDVPYALVRAA
jgi:KaiC/GvpD/RAD55 family RecA-like ATPase